LHFYTLLALDDQLKIVIETIKLQEEALLIMQIQKEAAVANELAVKQFEAQLLNSKGLELQVIQDIVETESRINFLVGRFPQPVVRTRSEFTGNLPYHVNAGLPSELLQKRPDIRQAELDLIASKADVKSARAAFYPSFTITGGIGYQAFRTAFLFTTPQSMAYALVGGLTAPLINRNAIQREFKQATAAQHQAMYAYQKTILQAFMEVHNEMARIENLGQILEFKSQEAQVLNTAIETSSVLFRTGRANYMEVLMAQRNALKSKLELVDTKKQQYEAVINIYKALGGGWK
jgi:outer membrane protein TolC